MVGTQVREVFSVMYDSCNVLTCYSSSSNRTSLDMNVYFTIGYKEVIFDEVYLLFFSKTLLSMSRWLIVIKGHA